MDRKIQIGNFFEKDSFHCSTVTMPHKSQEGISKLVFSEASAEYLINSRAINNSDSFSGATK